MNTGEINTSIFGKVEKKPYGENADYLCLPEGMEFLRDDPGPWPTMNLK